MMGLDPLIAVGRDTEPGPATLMAEATSSKRILLGVLLFLAMAHLWLLADMAAWLRAGNVQPGAAEFYGFLAVAGWMAICALGLLWFAFLALFEATALETADGRFRATSVLGVTAGGEVGRPVRLFRVAMIGVSEQRPIRRATLIWGYAAPIVVSENRVAPARLAELLKLRRQ